MARRGVCYVPAVTPRSDTPTKARWSGHLRKLCSRSQPVNDSAQAQKGSRRWLLVTIGLAAVAVFAVTALLINIFERKQEARNPFYRVVDLNDTISDPAIWGKDF